MKRKLLFLLVLLSLIISACSGGGAEAPAADETPLPPTAEPATATPDLCSAENLPEQVAAVHKLMREFDDYSSLASKTPQSQLLQLIPDMQRVQRDAEDQKVPSCLFQLKKLQLGHMNLVVEILVAFMNNANPEQLNQAILQSRELHKQYDIEIARLLGITVVVPTNIPAATADPSSSAPVATTSAGEAVAVYATNPGPTAVNLRTEPRLDAFEAGKLDVQASTLVFGRSADSQWVKVEIPGQPGQTAWVFAALVQLSLPVEQLPVTE